ncbi:flagellar hook-length control protein FliK [Cognaticolwellia mytili]|uniref:flagellar hook-length control protein FliK n=1 Tax=Cognaticolwellia mytili TaxID=1888913 RepID=UPI000A16E845|nr:flagellar hook-length control protein FliK [Cognaticolwellia mytili]
MSKLSLLSVEVSQSTDIKGSNANKPAENKGAETAFSDIIEQHNQHQKSDSATTKVNGSGNDEGETVNDDRIKLIEDSKGNEDKSLKDEEYTLPVPIIYETEHAGKAINVEGNLEVLSMTASSVENNKSGSKEVKTSVSNVTDANGLLVDENKTVEMQPTKTNSDDAIDLLKMLGAAEKLITKTTADEHRINAGNNTDSEQPNNGIEKNLDVEKVIKSAGISSDALAQKQVASNDDKVNQTTTKQFDQIVKNNGADVQAIVKTSLTDDLSEVASSALTTAEQKALAQIATKSTEIAENISEDSSGDTLLESEKIISSASSESDKRTSLEKKISVNPLIEHEAKVIDKTAAQVTNQSNVQSASQVQANQAAIESERVNDTLQAKTINPNSENSSTPVTKEQVQQAVLNGKNVSTSDESSNKNTVKANEEINLAEAASEKLSPLPDKVAPIINQALDVGRPIMSAAEMVAQQEQSFESTMNRLSADTAQSQKSITALNTETIAIYRKDFANAVKDKVMVMINQKIQQIEIQLDPPEMGNVHVRVNLQNEQAAVQFIVQNPQAKDALEQNMGKLRDMLAESGVDVGDSNIEQRQPGEQSETSFGENGASDQNNDNAEQEFNESHQQVVNMVKASSTGVDYYA